MTQKLVKIIGLSLNHSLGIVNACEVKFDKDNKLIVVKGASGNGKSTFQEAIQIGIHGTKAMEDNQKYGEIDLELQLSDGELPLFVGRRSKGKKIISTLYIKDINGKIDREPIIDGIKATTAKYFEHLETELTWRMPELTSDNPKVQKKVLLSMYQSQLKKIGVIFDKKHPDYGISILGKIDAAVLDRDNQDYERKRVGGIADDLKAQGFDPDRPDTCPDSVDVGKIDNEIKELEKERTLATAEPEAQKAKDLSEIKAQAQIKITSCLTWNNVLKENYDNGVKEYNDYTNKTSKLNEILSRIQKDINLLNLDDRWFTELKDAVKFPDQIKPPQESSYIQFNEDGQVIDSPNVGAGATTLLIELNELRQQYANRANQTSNIDTTKFDEKILIQEKNKLDAQEINKIVSAIDAFHEWRASNEEVVRLKDEYVKLLAQIDTGVKGLEIQPIEDDIFLMYDGSYDLEYFQPKDKKPVMRKLSSYSGTQKPVICLLIQNYLLSKKPKALRYMYIDNIPMDSKVRALIERMTEELNLTVFLNITGDFEKKELKDGEILINGGEIFFNN